MKKILIVGCGDIGARLAPLLATSAYECWGLRRQLDKLPAGIKGIAADVTSVESLQVLQAHHFDTVLFTLTPGEFNDQRYQQVYVNGTANVLAALSQQNLKRIYFVSSTSVYGQQDGEWVDEDSETAPTSFSGKRLLEAEQHCRDYPVPSTIIRFAGIYGAGKQRVIADVLAGKGSTSSYTNRIHRDDCAGFIAHLLMQPNSAIDACYIGVDNEPVNIQDVKQWLAEQLACPVPPKVASDTVKANKRCTNKRLLASGYQLIYPNYKAGYQAIMAASKSQS